MKICGFCDKPMDSEPEAGQGIFDVFRCSDCLSPKYHSSYRRLYHRGSKVLLTEAIRLENFYVVKYHQPISSGEMHNHTVISRDILGIMNDDPNMSPVTFTKPVCELDYLLDLPLKQPELLLHKLNLYTVFS